MGNDTLQACSSDGSGAPSGCDPPRDNNNNNRGSLFVVVGVVLVDAVVVAVDLAADLDVGDELLAQVELLSVEVVEVAVV